MYPAQRFHNICHARIAGISVFLTIGGHIQVAQNIQAMVQRNNHNISVFRQSVAFIRDLFYGGAVRESAAMEPHHNRLLRRSIQAGCPDVQILAIFVGGPEAMGNIDLSLGRGCAVYRTDVSIVRGILHALPGLHRGWHLPALCVGIFDTVECINAV